MIHWLNRLREYWNDKKLAKKCGLQIKDICVHEPDVQLEGFKTLIGFDKSNGGEWFKCKKCGGFYR